MDGGWCLRRVSAVSRISRSPDRKTSTSPRPSRASSSTASEMACCMASSRSPAFSSSGRAVAHLHRIGAPGDLDHGAGRPRREVPGEALAGRWWRR